MSSMKTRVPELDGIRGMAILLVLVWHFGVGPIGATSSSLLRFLSQIGMQTERVPSIVEG